jgi:hypothetical protein
MPAVAIETATGSGVPWLAYVLWTWDRDFYGRPIDGRLQRVGRLGINAHVDNKTFLAAEARSTTKPPRRHFEMPVLGDGV